MNIYRDGVFAWQTCLSESQAGAIGVITPGMVVAEFKKLKWPVSELSVQPPNGRSIVNFPTNFFTTNVRPSTQTVPLLGQQVTIEATPSQYVYRFDAESQLASTSPGAAYPRLLVTHEYTSKGSVSPRVDTTYSGRYQINGGPWRDIPETLTVAGTPVALELVEVRPTLVTYD